MPPQGDTSKSLPVQSLLNSFVLLLLLPNLLYLPLPPLPLQLHHLLLLLSKMSLRLMRTQRPSLTNRVQGPTLTTCPLSTSVTTRSPTTTAVPPQCRVQCLSSARPHSRRPRLLHKAQCVFQTAKRTKKERAMFVPFLSPLPSLLPRRHHRRHSPSWPLWIL